MFSYFEGEKAVAGVEKAPWIKVLCAACYGNCNVLCRSFADGKELQDDLVRKKPEKIDIGGVYNVPVCQGCTGEGISMNGFAQSRIEWEKINGACTM